MTGRFGNRNRADIEIGNPRGRIALYLDEQDAYDLADCFRHDDLGRREIIDAIQVAYPPEDE